MKVLTDQQKELYKSIAFDNLTGIIQQSVRDARNIPWYVDPSARSCYLCNRRKDYLFNKVVLVSVFDASSETFREVCLNHRSVTGSQIFNCVTGDFIDVPHQKNEAVLFLEKIVYSFSLRVTIAIRFIWFLIANVFQQLYFRFQYLRWD